MNLSILSYDNPKKISIAMKEMGVCKEGIAIMVPKAMDYLIKIDTLSPNAANILKQEMLSLGGDVAISRDAITGKIKNTACMLMGNLRQLNFLGNKLQSQPFGLSELGAKVKSILRDYRRDEFTINLNRFNLRLGRRTQIMGIVNLTPDSFSRDGLYSSQVTAHKSQEIIDFIEKMVRDGANIIDIGGESSRPGAESVSLKEELARTIPVIKMAAKKIKVPISIDTYKPEVARRALDNGAVIVNDITALGNPRMQKIISQYKAAAVIMHMLGRPQTMQKKPRYESLVSDIMNYLNKSIDKAKQAGIDEKKIIIDPGIGFGKTVEHNLEILKRLREFKTLGKPILVGPSRKFFIGKILKLDVQDRLMGTAAAVSLAIANGAHIVRVHDVKEISQTVKLADAIVHLAN